MCGGGELHVKEISYETVNSCLVSGLIGHPKGSTERSEVTSCALIFHRWRLIPMRAGRNACLPGEMKTALA